MSAGGAAATRCLITAAVAARDGAEQIASARADALDLVAAARAEGFAVADDGSVTGGATSPLLVSLSGGRDRRRLAALEPEQIENHVGHDHGRNVAGYIRVLG